MVDDLGSLLTALEAATGSDPALDRSVARALDAGGEAGGEYTASVDHCLGLLATTLPGWTWHVGYGAGGLFPYAALTNGQVRVIAEAPTVPLALLVAIVKARIGEVAKR